MVKRVRLADVAGLAKVSSQTVSRVVRGEGTVSPDTRDRVLAAIEELDYQPNVAARTLASKTTGLVQVLIGGELHYGYSRIFAAISQALTKSGYQVLVSDTSRASKTTSGGRWTISSMQCDGLIVLGVSSRSAELAMDYGGSIPVVLILDGHQGLEGVSTVSVNQTMGARAAVEHLVEGGAKRLLHVCGPLEWEDARLRLEGFRDTCRERGYEHAVRFSADWNAERGYLVGREIDWDKYDGVFAANDYLALGVMRALHESGRDVPGDCAVVGFDDQVGAGSYIPPLTTVRQDYVKLGRRAVEELVSLIGGNPTRDVSITPELVSRDSTPTP